MKKILVETDFSNASKTASIYAAELAKVSGAKIILHNSYVSKEDQVPELLEHEKIKNKQQLEIEANFLRKLNGIEVDTLITEDDSIKEILAIEVKDNIDLVIVGINKTEALTKYIFGSVITDLIAKTQVPVIVIPEESTFKRIERIVFAIDFNLETELEMHEAIKDLLQLFSPKIFVLNVVKENSKIRPDRKISEYNIEKYFDNEKHIYSFIQDNDLIHGLNEFILVNKIDIITILPHKHNLFENMFFESKTKEMAFNTTIPLIIFPMRN